MTKPRLDWAAVQELRYLRFEKNWPLVMLATRFGVSSVYAGMVARGECRMAASPGDNTDFDPRRAGLYDLPVFIQGTRGYQMPPPIEGVEQRIATLQTARLVATGPAPAMADFANADEVRTSKTLTPDQKATLLDNFAALEKVEQRHQLAAEIGAVIQEQQREQEERELDEWIGDDLYTSPITAVPNIPKRPSRADLEKACAKRWEWRDISPLKKSNAFIHWADIEHVDRTHRQMIIGYLFLALPSIDQGSVQMRKLIAEMCEMFDVSAESLPLTGQMERAKRQKKEVA